MKVNSNGNSLVQVMVAAGIMSVVALGVATMISDQNKQVKALTEKLLTKETELSIKNVFLDSNYCSCIFRGKTFDTTTNSWSAGITVIPNAFTAVPAFPAACTASGTNIVPAVGAVLAGGSTMTVGAIGLTSIVETTAGSGNYSANIEVGFNNTVQSIKNIKTNITFSINTTGGTGPTDRPFSGCGISTSVSSQQFGNFNPAIACHANTCCYSVTFPTAFAAAPQSVIVTPFFQDYGNTNSAITTGVNTVSSAGFSACFDHIGNSIDNNFSFYWIAFP